VIEGVDSRAPIVHVVGARPNFMKAGPVLSALRDAGANQLLIHTGQHYDPALSEVFFDELGLPQPTHNLGVGSGSHAAQTASIMTAFEAVLLEQPASMVVVYGDVNSTVACALVAAKLGVPIAHVEAGLRSFDRSMPEEINRLLTDHLSDLLFVTAPEGLENLAAEGISGDGVHFVGNPMIDTLLRFRDRFDPAAAVSDLRIERPYAVATVHRPSNVDQPAAARRIVTMLMALSERLHVVLALHPRGRDALREQGLRESPRLIVTPPKGYLEFMSLVTGAAIVVTDSGGIQEETTALGIPCLTIRPNTERPITISHGTNRLVTPDDVPKAAEEVLTGNWAAGSRTTPPLWDGHAGERIARIMVAR
jgi:UDP-N-acetylglucosamine 2-epimerase (non-hydrolysing)